MKKKCLSSLEIKEMKTMKYHFIPNRLSNIKKSDTGWWPEHGKMGTLKDCCPNWKCYFAIPIAIWQYLVKVRMCMDSSWAILIWVYILNLRKCLCSRKCVTRMFMAAVFVRAKKKKNWKHPKHSAIRRRLVCHTVK